MAQVLLAVLFGTRLSCQSASRSSKAGEMKMQDLGGRSRAVSGGVAITRARI